MSKVNIFEIKAKLSEYLDRALRGEHIVICRHNTPVAELRAIDQARANARPIGPLAGRPTFVVPPTFFEPLSDEELDAWDGSEANPLPAMPRARARAAPRAAEKKATYRSRRSRARRGKS